MGNFIEVFKDDNRRFQLRLNIPFINKEIRNIKLILNKGYFNRTIIWYYERHKYQGQRHIIEFYDNFELNMYSETILENGKNITTFFSSKGEIFSQNTLTYDTENNLIDDHTWVLNDDGTITTS